MCDLLIAERINASQLALDGGSIISKIIEIEKKCKVEIERTHVKTKNDAEESGNSYGNNFH